MLLHSYMLVKKVANIEDHKGAAMLLDRVSKNISQFPSHAVNILTSTVIECIKANYKYLAYQWAI